MLSFAKRRPFATNVGMSVIVAGASDWLAQRAEGAQKFDTRRNLLMCTFSLFMGVLCFNVYMHAFGRLFPHALRFSNLSWAQKMRDVAGQRDVLKQTVLDLGVWMPCVYFPVFYCFKTILQNDGKALVMHEVPAKAMQKYEKTWLSDNTACLGVWIPGDILVFVVPTWLRMPACYAVSFAWTTLLSLTRGSAHSADV